MALFVLLATTILAQPRPGQANRDCSTYYRDNHTMHENLILLACR
jgi:hypothetical protein